jgi:hypothetical protein
METYSLSRVFSRAWDNLKANFWRLLGFDVLAYLCGFVAILIVALIMLFIGIAAFIPMGHSTGTPVPPSMGAIVYVIFAYATLISISIFFSAFCHSGGIRILLGKPNGETAQIGDAFTTGFQKLLPKAGFEALVMLIFLAVYIVVFFVCGMLAGATHSVGLVVAAALLMMIGCAYIFARWSVGGVSIVDEDTQAVAAFGRSAWLTKGSVGKIFATNLIYGLFFLTGYIILFFMFFGSFYYASIQASLAHEPLDPSVVSSAMLSLFIGELLLLVYILVFSAYAQSLGVSIYHEVKLVKEHEDGEAASAA